MQVQKDLNFYDNILEEFTAEDIVSLGLDSRGDTTQESSAVMTIADAAETADITADAVIFGWRGRSKWQLRMAQWSAWVTADRWPLIVDHDQQTN